MSSRLRKRPAVDYKVLHEGTATPPERKRVQPAQTWSTRALYVLEDGQFCGIILAWNNLVLYELASLHTSPLADTSINSVIATICQKYNIDFQMVNTKPLAKTLNFKIKYMLGIYAKAKKSGGNQIKKLLSKWSTSSYDVNIDCDFNVDGLCNEKVKKKLKKKKKNVTKLQRELSDANSEQQELRNSLERMARQLVGATGTRGKAKNKKVYSKVQKRRHKHARAVKVKDMLSFLKTEAHNHSRLHYLRVQVVGKLIFSYKK
ncbi:hypothetical protein HOLleu_13525 [Holothuria leucospilota]|uniref:Uncharacterized protein n=1 Tax=Holothuria leucospilota TaxID=206669 RepID=A0A9Q1HAX1_HOLLE|nr:hypothetical protein HOLleu_13525 [Holothuria leucospilota]